MDLQGLKNHLRIDHEEDDTFLNTICLPAAERFLYNVTGKIYGMGASELMMEVENATEFTDTEEALADIIVCAFVSDLYDNRELTTTEKTARKMNYLYNSILTQLTYS